MARRDALLERLEALPSHQRRWMRAGLATLPADRPCAEAAVRLLYEALGHRAPRSYLWSGSPAGALARYEDAGRAPLLPRVVGMLPRGREPVDSGWDLGGEVRWYVWHGVGRHVLSALERLGTAAVPEWAWYGQLDAASLASVTVRATDGRRGAALDAYDLLADAAGFAFATEDVCYLSERPRLLRMDDRGRLHAAEGPALVYPDGWALHAWRGELVSPRAVGPAASLTVADVHDARNVELRRHLLERMGYERYLRESRAICMQRDRCGELYRIEQPEDEPLVLVHVVNATPEPDGTRRRYTLRVPPTVDTAREAVAWTFGLAADDYEPLVES